MTECIANEGHLSQMWFAGNHSDIGGSYPETESRLSDISLQWMIEETQKLRYPLKLGPVTVHGQKLDGTGSDGTPLHLFPAANGVQHCEIAGMHDALEDQAAKLPRWMRGFVLKQGYETNVRKILPLANIHPTVLERLALPAVVQCAKVGRYLPEALKDSVACQVFYPQPAKVTSEEKPIL